MTRRKIYFFDTKTNKLYSTPEFNGDKSEFELFRKRGDSCDKNFDEILTEFDGVTTLEGFIKASDKAQSYYYSALVGIVKLPVEEVNEITDNDEIYMLDKKGKSYLYNPSEIKRKYILDMCDRGNFTYKGLTMNVTRFKHENKKHYVYKLNMLPIKNSYSGNELYLGDFANNSKNKYWEYEFNKNLNILIGKIEKCKLNSKKQPLKIELIEQYNDEYSISFKSENGECYGLSNGGDCIFLTTLDNEGNPKNHILDFIDPILWNQTNIYAIYLEAHDGIGYEKKYFDIPRIEMAYKINSYITAKENNLSNEIINKNLNTIYKEIYNRENIEEYFFKRYENEKDFQKLKKEYYKLLEQNTAFNIEEENEEENEL